MTAESWRGRSGKSTVGRLVGGALKYPFLDTDALIETSAGCSIPDSFEAEGEEAFRDLEAQVLQARARPELTPHSGCRASSAVAWWLV